MPDPYELPGLHIPKLLGRSAVLAGLVRDLAERETPDHISVVAPRYFGKSVLIQALAQRFTAPGSHYRVVINWDLRHNTPETDRAFQIALAKALDRCLLEIGNDSYHDYLQDTEGDPAGTISDVVDSLAAEEMRILILLDDFDRLASQPQISKNLWDYLRSLAQKNHLRFVLSSRRRLRECIPSRDGRTSDFWNNFTNVVTLRPFSSSDLDEFLAPIREAGFSVDPSSKQAILDWTGGIPVLAARLCGDIFACPPARIDRPLVESRVEQISGDAWMQDTLTLLWDDCGKETQGDLLDIAEDSLVVRGLPPIRQQLLSDRGYIAQEGGGYKVQCRFMQKFAAGHEARGRDLRDLFKDPDTELRSLKTLLQLRLSAVTGGDTDTRSYIEHAIDGLARGQRTALTSIRSIAEEALSVAWEVECPSNAMPAAMQQQLTKAWDVGGGGMGPEVLQKLNDKNTRRRILRVAAGDQGRIKVTQKVSRPMMLLIDYLYNLGNYGQHMTDIPAAQETPADISFCACACWSAIELLKRMSEDLR
ncbi:MAG: NACHT domain-containing protein [Sulfuritalea sp.]|nr:NACHT domain-containing protein [Sulfuritalea sp.]